MNNAQTANRAEDMNRRTMITGTAAIALSAPTLANAADNVVSPELAALIEAHKAAFAGSNDALDHEQSSEGSYFAENNGVMTIDLSVGGAQDFHTKNDIERGLYDCRDAIARRYDALQSQCGPIAKIDKPLAEKARDVLAKGKARDLRRLRAAYRSEMADREAAGYAQAVQARGAAFDAERDALNAILAFKPTTAADSDAKGRYLLSTVGGRFCDLASEQVAILFRSMTVDGVES